MSVVTKLYDDARHAVRYFLLRRLPTCKAIAPMMSESLERTLTLRERIVLRMHLAICVWCEWYLDQIGELRRANLARGTVDAAESSDSGPGLSDEARERIRSALERER
jgi:hypothetical protein